MTDDYTYTRSVEYDFTEIYNSKIKSILVERKIIEAEVHGLVETFMYNKPSVGSKIAVQLTSLNGLTKATATTNSKGEFATKFKVLAGLKYKGSVTAFNKHFHHGFKPVEFIASYLPEKNNIDVGIIHMTSTEWRVALKVIDEFKITISDAKVELNCIYKNKAHATETGTTNDQGITKITVKIIDVEYCDAIVSQYNIYTKTVKYDFD